MEIISVNAKNDLKKFIDLPFQIYRGDPIWIPPLRDEIAGQFDTIRNPF